METPLATSPPSEDIYRSLLLSEVELMETL